MKPSERKEGEEEKQGQEVRGEEMRGYKMNLQVTKDPKEETEPAESESEEGRREKD